MIEVLNIDLLFFFKTRKKKNIINNKIESLYQEKPNRKVAAEVMPFQKFWIAEEYHQNYERLNPDNSYIQNVSIPRLKKFQKQYPELLKDNIKH